MRSLLSKFRFNLLTRIALALATVGLVPLVLATVALVNVNQGGMRSQVAATHALATRTTAESISRFLEVRIALARSLAANDELTDPRSPGAASVLRESLSSWAGLDVLALVIVNADREEALRAQLPGPEALEKVTAAIAAPAGKALHPVGRQHDLVLRIEEPLDATNGFLWVICDTRTLPDVLEPDELGERADLVLADRDLGVLLGDPQNLAEFPAKQVERAFVGLETGLRDQGGQRFEDFLGGHAAVANSDWAVLSRQPIQVADKVSRRMRNAAAQAVGGSLLAIGLLVGASYWTVVRPIRLLLAAQRRLTGGISGDGDEISQLRSSFEILEQRMKERQAFDEVFLGRYMVQDVIGSGAMGTVFKGLDPKLERPVALKTIRLDKKIPAKKRKELLSQLVQEAVTVAKFNHPNIVQVYDVEDSPEGTFVAMEFIDGNSLEFARWQNERLEIGQVVVLGAAIARGLQSAHQNGVVHRDIKPANILLGVDGSIKVTDFGISELISAMSPEGDVVFGTPGYLPPETLQGRGYDTSGDLFSLGVVLYYCVTGQRPFVGKTLREVIRKTMFGKVTPPSQLQPTIPQDLEALILRLLAREPAGRPGSAAEVAEALDEMARREGYVWQTPSLGESDVFDSATEVVPQTQWMQTTRI